MDTPKAHETQPPNAVPTHARQVHIVNILIQAEIHGINIAQSGHNRNSSGFDIMQEINVPMADRQHKASKSVIIATVGAFLLYCGISFSTKLAR